MKVFSLQLVTKETNVTKLPKSLKFHEIKSTSSAARFSYNHQKKTCFLPFDLNGFSFP